MLAATREKMSNGEKRVNKNTSGIPSILGSFWKFQLRPGLDAELFMSRT